jgi:glycosyltransferase involved in cell wall biosynthesis
MTFQPTMASTSAIGSDKFQSAPLVSIVTPSFNHVDYIEKTILSVLMQDYQNVEYIVVDGLSTDGTSNLLRKYSNRISKIIIENDEGQSDAIDKGFRASSGDIMAYINSDDCYASPNVVSRAVQLFAENQDVDVIYGRRQFIDAAGFFALNQPFRVFDAGVLKKACYIPQECVFWRRGIYAKAGNHIKKSLHFAMDYELWLRYLENGAKFLAVDEVFGLFRHYSEQKSQSAWIEHGLPEIAQLQKTYFGQSLSESDMKSAHDEYLFGISRQKNSQIWNESHPSWMDFLKAKQDWLRCCPLDIWVFKGSYAR